MKAPRNKFLLAAFFLQLIIPLSGVFLVHTALIRGQEATIKMAAYDPYDAFRGRYLQLEYPNPEIPLEPGSEKQIQDMERLPDLYVSLETDPDTGLSRFSSASLQRPSPGSLYIRCNASYYSLWQSDGQTTVRIYPRIDKYYLNESEAIRLDRTIRQDTDIQLKIKVWNGMYVIDSIRIDGINY